jgi:hypothetical protein
MKKLIIAALFFVVNMSAFAQTKEIEAKLTKPITESELLTLATQKGVSLNCNCPRNLISDPGFLAVTNSSGSSDISSTSTPWKIGDGTPQSTQIAGACDKGFVLMWGNNTVGESIMQNVTLPAGAYTVKFNAQYRNTPGAHNPYVKLRIASGSNRSGTIVGTSTAISNTAWDGYSMTIVVPAISALCFFPVNDNTQNDGSYVSWIHLDNICIEKKDPCADCPIPNTNVNFSLCTTLGGGTVANVSAVGASTGLGNGWTLKQVPCPGPNPCKWVAGGIKWMSTGSSIVIPAAVLTPGCYVLTHYVNRCSKQWDPKACLSYQTICFTICDNAITVSKEQNPKPVMKVQSGEEIKDEVEREAEQVSGQRN